jgi:hypothetical protein
LSCVTYTYKVPMLSFILPVCNRCLCWCRIFKPLEVMFVRVFKKLTLSTQDHLFFRICQISSQHKAFGYQRRMSNFNFSDICIFGRNTVSTRLELPHCLRITIYLYDRSNIIMLPLLLLVLLLFLNLFSVTVLFSVFFSIRNRKLYKSILVL